MSEIKPLGDRVVIKRSKSPSTKGGILLPDSAQEKPKEGVIVAVGPGKLNDEGARNPMNVKIGDRILFSSYAGTEIKNTKNEGDELLIMKEEDILGVVLS